MGVILTSGGGKLVQLKWGKLEEVNVGGIEGYGHVIE